MVCENTNIIKKENWNFFFALSRKRCFRLNFQYAYAANSIVQLLMKKSESENLIIKQPAYNIRADTPVPKVKIFDVFATSRNKSTLFVP